MLHRLKPRWPALTATAIALISGALFVVSAAESAAATIQIAGPAPAGRCLDVANITHQNLLGTWVLQWLPTREHPSMTTVLTLSDNPDHPGSLTGTLTVDGHRHLLAGDLEDGVLTLEESVDGKSIHANWTGQPVLDSCGQKILGTWQSAKDGLQREFTLRRMSGW